MTRDRLLLAIDALGAEEPATPADVRGLLRAIAISVPDPGLGVVRAKSVLRTRIDQMVEDNATGQITPADVRDVLDDMVDSLLDEEAVQAGAGIAVSRDAGSSRLRPAAPRRRPGSRSSSDRRPTLRRTPGSI